MVSTIKNTPNAECGCTERCCEPTKKPNTMKKIVFLIIVLVVISIIAFKFSSIGTGSGSSNVSNAGMGPASSDSAAKCCNTEKSACCPQLK